MEITQRDEFVCQDYHDGKDIHELSRTHGLSERRISQILKDRGIIRRPRNSTQKKPLSREHARLGLYLYTFRLEKGFDVYDAANDLGWSRIKLRKIENGIKEVELLDLMDISAYTHTTIEELLGKFNGS
jgi:hypothetical protein